LSEWEGPYLAESVDLGHEVVELRAAVTITIASWVL